MVDLEAKVCVFGLGFSLEGLGLASALALASAQGIQLEILKASRPGE